MNSIKYDAVLYCQSMINEDLYSDAIDQELYQSMAFGLGIQNALNNMGDGFSAEVCDFKKWVTVKITFHNRVTSRTSSKTFLIVFQNKEIGAVFSTSNKWRTINGAGQAISYIKAASNALRSETNNKL